MARSLADIQARRELCVLAVSRRARIALEYDEQDRSDEERESEWLSYAALLVQVDRIVVDLSAPLPT